MLGKNVNIVDFSSGTNENYAQSSDDIFAAPDEQSFLEASKHTHWTDAMNTEMEALLRNDIWEITDFPKDRKAIGSKWVYRIKYKLDDVNNAFLYDDLDETVYMKLLNGYYPANDTRVCRLKNGFSQSKSDYSLYNKNVKGVFIALLVYVDDEIITEDSIVEIEKFKEFLKTKFMIKDLGKLKYLLGIEVINNKDGICLNELVIPQGLKIPSDDSAKNSAIKAELLRLVP
ncbi:ribonuclease H-like domain-containing protein [Tanacetum coccineum]